MSADTEGPLEITAENPVQLFQIIAAGILVREIQAGNITDEWAERFVKDTDAAFEQASTTGFIDITLKEKLNA